MTDHVWQTSAHGVESDPMLESYVTLGFLAGRTKSVELLTLVSAVTYRPPGLLAEMVTTLDVLSGGRAMLGVGAGWNEEEATGLGMDFYPPRHRFDRLEEALQILARVLRLDWRIPRAALHVVEHAQLPGAGVAPTSQNPGWRRG